jgi:hypothetical protein
MKFKFAMKVEQKKSLSFLHVVQSKGWDGSLGHTVYGKSLYLHAKSVTPSVTEAGSAVHSYSKGKNHNVMIVAWT